jgi:adenylate kinase family enzyme
VTPAEVYQLLSRPLDYQPLHQENLFRALDQAGHDTRPGRLGSAFGLPPLDMGLIAVALAPEIDGRYERIYGFLQNDVTRKRPTVQLALRLLCPDLETRLAARQRLDQTSPLLRYQLLRLVDDPADHQPSLLGKYLQLDERLVNYLLGADLLDPRLLAYVQFAPDARALDDLLLPGDLKRRMAGLLREPLSGALVCYFQGAYGAGRQTTAAALCRDLGLGLLAVDGERLAQQEWAAFETTTRLAIREAVLQGAALYWAGFDALLADEHRPQRDLLLRELSLYRGVTFLAGETTWEPADLPPTLAFVRIEFSRPAYAERLQLWMHLLDTDQPDDAQELRALADKFRFSAGQIRDAVATARSLARWRAPGDGHVQMADLAAACRLQSNRKLATLARKVTPHYGWDAIVLPADRIEQLREICHYVRYRAQVYDFWGFDRKLSLGKGLNVLFAGPSGTGKTMAAEIIAGELGLDLYKIDLSTVVSKYIGETEKNLARIFAEAETSNAILFFDEADALFGKRSEVKDSHDRYANLEIAYLLQRMEEYEGVVILATNLRKNMDDAFVRRIHATVEFPFPGETDRRRIWESIWPDELPRDPAVDPGFLAQRFEIAGGNIRNVALAAAFLAAAEGATVGMPQIVRAMRREYQKIGKVVAEDEFGPYAGWLVEQV